MITEILEPTKENIERAGRMLKEGKLVAFPTETVYGLGADAFNEEAVKAVYQAKGRPSDNPMIVHIADFNELNSLTVEVTEDMKKLADAIWPGPLTMVCNKVEALPKVTTGGLDTVGIRMPENEIARAMIKAAGVPVAAPSANLSGKPSPTKKEHVIHDLDGRVDAILTGDDSRVGIESTVIDMTGEIPVILRPGIVGKHEISNILNKEVIVDKGLVSDDETPKAPGMKYRHYAPEAEMVIFKGRDYVTVNSRIKEERARYESEGKRVGVILFNDEEYVKAAHDFFARLRELDEEGVDIILAGALSEEDDVGFAVMNRMLKSSGFNVEEI